MQSLGNGGHCSWSRLAYAPSLQRASRKLPANPPIGQKRFILENLVLERVRDETLLANGQVCKQLA